MGGESRRELASYGVQYALKMRRFSRRLTDHGSSAFPLQESINSRHHDLGGPVVKVRELCGRNHSEDHLQLQQLVGRGSTVAMLIATHLTVATETQQRSEVALAQAGAASQDSNPRNPMFCAFIIQRQPSIVFFHRTSGRRRSVEGQMCRRWHVRVKERVDGSRREDG
jgi:hypothetical protein